MLTGATLLFIFAVLNIVFICQKYPDFMESLFTCSGKTIIRRIYMLVTEITIAI